MGIWETLTKQRGLGSAAFRWREPMCYRIRLRGDFAGRAGMLLAAWAAAIGLFLVLFAFNSRPPGMSLAIWLGAVFGFGPAMLVLFLSREQVSGRITIDSEGIRRHRNYASLTLTGMWGEWSEWPFESIDRAVIVPGDALGQSFSVLLLSIDSEWEIVGIPASVEWQKVGKFLASQGTKVSQGKSIPAPFVWRYSMPVAAGAAAVGVIVLGAGIGTYAVKVQGPFGAVAQKPQHDLPDAGIVVAKPEPHRAALGGKPGIRADAPVMPAPFLPEEPRGPGNALIGTPTVLAGGSGGTPFHIASADRQPMVGIRFSIGNWAGRDRVGTLTPLFDPDEAAGPNVVMAREGYAVGAIDVDAEEFVDAVVVTFMRVKLDGALDTRDSYRSEWIGRPTGNPPETIGGAGGKVIGLCGRGGAVLDSLGLVLDR